MPPPVEYLALRLVRRAMPQRVIDWMLTNKVYLRPGSETSMLDSAWSMYREISGEALDVAGRTVLVFGYGGTFGLALSLLEQGARHVYLQDPFVAIRTAANRRLPADRMARFFQRVDGDWVPDPQTVTIATRHLPAMADELRDSVDIVLSNSVFEHVDDVQANVVACAAVTKPGGYNLHLIYLRDHFFKYPFEMLRYSEPVWRGWLNASNNLNRYRYRDYERCFRTSFDRARARPRRVLRDEFEAMRGAIRPEFLSGNDEVDACGTMIVECWKAPCAEAT